MAKAKTVPKLTKEQVLSALRQLSDEDKGMGVVTVEAQEEQTTKEPGLVALNNRHC